MNGIVENNRQKAIQRLYKIVAELYSASMNPSIDYPYLDKWEMAEVLAIFEEESERAIESKYSWLTRFPCAVCRHYDKEDDRCKKDIFNTNACEEWIE